MSATPTPTEPRAARPVVAARGPRSARRRTVLGAATTVLVGGGLATASLGGTVAPASAAATCRTPTPKVTNAGAARAAVERLARRAGTTVTRRPRITSPSSRPPSRLVKEDVVSCSGRKAKLGDRITVRYSLVNWGGKSATIDSTWSRGTAPALFPLEKGALIEGWTQGIPGMRVGSRRLLVVPPSKGYGRQGTPDGSVPANTTLIFVIDLVKIG